MRFDLFKWKQKMCAITFSKLYSGVLEFRIINEL